MTCHIGENARVKNATDCGEHVVTATLEGAWCDTVGRVEHRVVHVTIGNVGDVHARNLADITIHAVVCVRWDNSTLGRREGG